MSGPALKPWSQAVTTHKQILGWEEANSSGLSPKSRLKCFMIREESIDFDFTQCQNKDDHYNFVKLATIIFKYKLMQTVVRESI